MSGSRLLRDAEHRIAEIYHYTLARWGEEQAELYYQGLLDTFEALADRAVVWRELPAEFDIAGYFCRYERHLIYWRLLDDGKVGIGTILHERMHQVEMARVAFEP
ncbi:type II toxin-antitoxin system RelE/ParE family toxin [Sphingomonas sp. MMS12-HWE2-04]|uniref:type II toxin-antitoxin system RelE/ParE family toxin n=1 Tax=Sphingomonas sp. MMS12-HWE2-04 TaxID=3234199 RepID=UPI00384DAF43